MFNKEAGFPLPVNCIRPRPSRPKALYLETEQLVKPLKEAPYRTLIQLEQNPNGSLIQRSTTCTAQALNPCRAFIVLQTAAVKDHGTFFPNAQQKGSRLEVGGPGVRELTRNPCGAFASVRKAPLVGDYSHEIAPFRRRRMCVFATNLLLTLESQCSHCLRPKVSEPAASRG